tara:strand:- start:154 stop:972 length:819 start_codon:yes stop_codon:yes gene_type:complete
MIYSFGDSFTVGLGADRVWEESQLMGHPDWDTMTEDEKGTQRIKVENFRNENSFTTQFANKVGEKLWNLGMSGCSNAYIFNKIFEFGHRFIQDDLVLIGFTSSIRDSPKYFPYKIFGPNGPQMAPNLDVLKDMVEFKVAEQMEKDYIEESMEFFKEYSRFYLTEMFDEQYYEIINYNIIVFLQKYFEYKKVNYIMLDAFDHMVTKKYKHIDTKYYWNFNKKTIYTYLKSFNDESLLEVPGYNDYDQVPRHPSVEGHKIFAEELYKFYNKVYK